MTDIPWTCITRVALEVQTSLDEPWTLDAMAGRAGYEAGHFAKTYHRIVGRPPVDHVRALRLERAAHALDTTDRSVTTVAMDAGFGSPDAFTRAFRRRFGCSPTSFRTRRAAEGGWGPEACPTGLRIDRATRVERGFEGQARPMGTEPAEMEASMRDAASRGRVFGAYAQPWGWYAERFAPESFVLVVDVAGPPEEPWLPARIPARPWLRVPWEGGPYEVAPAILWLHERGAAEGGMRVGFAPTVTLFAPHGLDVWLPLRR